MKCCWSSSCHRTQILFYQWCLNSLQKASWCDYLKPECLKKMLEMLEKNQLMLNAWKPPHYQKLSMVLNSSANDLHLWNFLRSSLFLSCPSSICPVFLTHTKELTKEVFSIGVTILLGWWWKLDVQLLSLTLDPCLFCLLGIQCLTHLCYSRVLNWIANVLWVLVVLAGHCSSI